MVEYLKKSNSAKARNEEKLQRQITAMEEKLLEALTLESVNAELNTIHNVTEDALRSALQALAQDTRARCRAQAIVSLAAIVSPPLHALRFGSAAPPRGTPSESCVTVTSHDHYVDVTLPLSYLFHLPLHLAGRRASAHGAE